MVQGHFFQPPLAISIVGLDFFVAISNFVMFLDDCSKVTTDTLTNYQEKQRYSREIRKNLRKSDIPKKLATKSSHANKYNTKHT